MCCVVVENELCFQHRTTRAQEAGCQGGRGGTSVRAALDQPLLVIRKQSQEADPDPTPREEAPSGGLWVQCALKFKRGQQITDTACRTRKAGNLRNVSRNICGFIKTPIMQGLAVPETCASRTVCVMTKQIFDAWDVMNLGDVEGEWRLSAHDGSLLPCYLVIKKQNKRKQKPETKHKTPPQPRWQRQGLST